MYLPEFPEHMSLYRISKMWELRLGHFSVFFQLQTVFWAVFETVVKNAKHQKVARGNYF